MIVQPDFLDHWKTRLLVDLTADPTAPLVVIRLWGFCQTSKRSFFPDMTPAQLASICHWGERKPACHIALVRAKFVEKLSPKGFAVHEWNEYNAKLLANWENGKKGGRPQKEENPNKTEPNEKPMGSGGLTQTKPIEQNRTDGLDQIEKREQNRTEQTAAPESSGSSSLDLKSGSGSGSGSVQSFPQLVNQLARNTAAGIYPEGGAPTLAEVQHRMNCRVPGAGQYAKKWLDTMNNRGWRDGENRPVMKWGPLADAWADGCVRTERGVGKRNSQKVGGNF